MQVLLFLTALLSALTGIAAGPGADESRLGRAEERLVAALQVIAPAAAAAIRPSQPLPPLAISVTGNLKASSPPVRPAPLATVKLIE